MNVARAVEQHAVLRSLFEQSTDCAAEQGWVERSAAARVPLAQALRLQSAHPIMPATQRLEPEPSRGLRDQLVSHDRYLLAIARRIVRNETDARDLVQDTYRRALEHEHQFIVDTNLRGWLTCILRNAHRDRMRHASFEILRATVSEELERGADLPDPGSPDVSAWRHIDDGDLAIALKRLPPLYRRVYTLREAGQPYNDIARQLGISTNTVATRIHRARLWLREALTARTVGSRSTSGAPVAVKRDAGGGGR